MLAAATGVGVTVGAAGSSATGVLDGSEMAATGADSSNESGQLGIACAGVAGSSSCGCPATSEEGGHAGIDGSVGGSGGQMSVSCGGAGWPSERGGHVDFSWSEATAFGGSVMGASVTSGGVEAAASDQAASPAAAGAFSTGCPSSTGSPGEVGTVCAHSGASLAPSPFAVDDASDQSGSLFLMGTAGAGVDSSAAASVGFDCAQTGVVSLVGTAVTGSSGWGSGGVESCGSEGSFSKIVRQSNDALSGLDRTHA